MTIINRRTFAIKPGRMSQAIDVLLMAHAATTVHSDSVRVYSSMFGDADLLQAEYEYANLAAYEAMWAAWSQTPVAAEFPAAMGPLEVMAHNNDLRQALASNDVPRTGGGVAVRYIRLRSGQGWQEMIAADIAEFVTPGEVVARLSSPHTGWWSELTLEMELASLADFEAKSAEWAARATTPAYLEAQMPRITFGGRVEVWRIHQ